MADPQQTPQGSASNVSLTGKPFAEVVMLHTLEYRVEQVRQLLGS